ncbi:ComF family protein [Sphingomonas sp. Leaf4]|uniref:ComF family protein n=1 Tax=Sphingomonas sp. Leaf4 TaxID=2876553 RepID=UPI001E347D8B|nr:ComF family protein [Sphingomonas sp. Leaf4]
MRPAALLAGLAALALPPRCPGCGVVVEADHRFCSACWSGLRFLGDPACARCGIPFAVAGEAVCDPCRRRPPAHGGVRAAVAYGPVARDVALKLKYGGRLALADTMARLMRRQVPGDVTLIVPVPLHRRRLWTRGYNQAVLIADALARATGLPVERHALTRIRATPPLRAMGRSARAKAVAGAFACGDPALFRGQAVLLVDDVHTSGSTTDGCARVLLAAGAASVRVLCWARVVGTDD